MIDYALRRCSNWNSVAWGSGALLYCRPHYVDVVALLSMLISISRTACSAVWILSCVLSAGRWHVPTPSRLTQAACHHAYMYIHAMCSLVCRIQASRVQIENILNIHLWIGIPPTHNTKPHSILYPTTSWIEIFRYELDWTLTQLQC